MIKWLKGCALIFGLSVSLCATAPASAQTLIVPGSQDNNNYGLMFDVTAANDVTISGLSFPVDMAGTFRLYGRPGTHVGFTGSSAGWTLLATGTMAAGADVAFPTPFSAPIPGGQTYALYLASSNGYLGYRNGTAVGTVIAADANISVLEGTGVSAPDFSGNTYTPRAFIGSVTYAPGLPPATVPTLTEWALIVLALALAGGGAVMILRRRRQGI